MLKSMTTIKSEMIYTVKERRPDVGDIILVFYSDYDTPLQGIVAFDGTWVQTVEVKIGNDGQPLICNGVPATTITYEKLPSTSYWTSMSCMYLPLEDHEY